MLTNRRMFISAIVGTFSLTLWKSVAKVTGRRHYGKAIWSGDEAEQTDSTDLLAMICKGGKVFVNGKQVRMVRYVDTVAGIVKTLDVVGDGASHFGPRLYLQLTTGESAPTYKAEVYRLARAAMVSGRVAMVDGKCDLGKNDLFPGREVSLPLDNVAVETLRGRVELYAPLKS